MSELSDHIDAVTSERDALRAGRDRLDALLERALEYLTHRRSCVIAHTYATDAPPCDCGLSDLLAEMPRDGDNP